METSIQLVGHYRKTLMGQLQPIRNKNKPFDLSESIDDMICCVGSATNIDDARKIYKEFGYKQYMFMAIGLFGTDEQKELFRKHWSGIKGKQ